MSSLKRKAGSLPSSFALLVNLLPAYTVPAQALEASPAPSVSALPAWFATTTQHPVSSPLPAWFTTNPLTTQHVTRNPVLSKVEGTLHHTIHEDDVTVTGPAEINNCDVVTYTIVATNDAITTTNVIITSTMPAGFTPTQRVIIVGATDTLGTGLRYHSGFTSTSYISIPVGQTRSFTVAAEIVACSGLDNNAEAAWGCSGETCQTRTAQANVDLVVRAPMLDYTPPNINVDYCAGQSTYTVTITNIGEGTAFTPSMAVNSNPLTITSSSANYSGGAFHLPDDIPAGDDYVLTFTLSLPDPPCGMVGDRGVFLYRPTYYDECDNAFYPPVKSSKRLSLTLQATSPSPGPPPRPTGRPTSLFT